MGTIISEQFHRKDRLETHDYNKFRLNLSVL